MYSPYSYPDWSNTNMYRGNYPFWFNAQMYNFYRGYPYPFWFNTPMYNPQFKRPSLNLKDYGPNPFVIDIDKATKQNETYRTALWTGDDLQVTLMSIEVGDDIGLEVHQEGDQFIRIEEGQGLVKMGDTKNNLDFEKVVFDDYAIMIPAGKWHNIINIGYVPLKLYAIYAPPEHPRDTVHETKEDAEADEYGNGY